MSNSDRIRAMDDEELAAFLFRWQVNFVSEFLQNGFVHALNFIDMKKWIAEPAKPHPIFEEWEDEG